MKTKNNIFEASIIIPTYNVSKYIEGTLISVFNQTMNNFEVIIVDDGSTDNTVDICEKLLSEKTIKYKILKQVNSGVSVARNKGIDVSEGEYIYILDSDDLVHKDFLKKMITTAKKNNSDIVFCGFDKIDERKNIIESYSHMYTYPKKNLSGKEAIELMLKEKIWICTISGIYKRDLVYSNNIRYTPKCTNGEDQEFCMKNLSNAQIVSCVNESLTFYVQRNSSISYSGSLKKFTALGAVRRTIKYLGDKEIENEIIQYLQYNKYQKEFFRNFNSLLKYKPDNEFITIVNNNNKFIKQLKRYKLIDISTKELKFLIRYKLYVHFPNLYTSIFKKLYKK